MYEPSYFSFSIKQMMFTFFCLFSSFSKLVCARTYSILLKELLVPSIVGWLMMMQTLFGISNHSPVTGTLSFFLLYTLQFWKSEQIARGRTTKVQIQIYLFIVYSLIHSIDNYYRVLETNIRTLVTVM